MEYLLITWLKDCNQKRIPTGTNNIMVKALCLFSSLNEIKLKGVTMIFSASRGWFEKFKARTVMHNESIYESWQEVTANTMRDVWKHLLPYCTNDFRGFEN
jgi:hypothetical protein